jgi:Uma2 family endonuclease
LIERNVGEKDHSLAQASLTAYLFQRRKEWQIEVFISLRIPVRSDWYAIPDICIYPLPGFEEPYPQSPPPLWIEILSHDDRIIDAWAKASDLVANGVPNVWIINPHSLESELRTVNGMHAIPDKTLRLPDTPIVIPLLEVMNQ